MLAFVKILVTIISGMVVIAVIPYILFAKNIWNILFSPILLAAITVPLLFYFVVRCFVFRSIKSSQEKSKQPKTDIAERERCLKRCSKKR